MTERPGARRLVVGGALVAALAGGVGWGLAPAWGGAVLAAGAVVLAAFVGAWIRCGAAEPAPSEVQPAPGRADIVHHAAAVVGIGHAEIDAGGRIGRVTAPLAALISRWPSAEAWWAAVRRTGGLPAATTCGACGRPEWRYTRVVEVTEPRGHRRVFELTATGHLAPCDADGGPAVTALLVTDATERVDREVLLAASRDEAVATGRVRTGELAEQVRALASRVPSDEVARLWTAAERLLAEDRAPSDATGVRERTFGVAALVHDLQPMAIRLVGLDRNQLTVRIRGELGVMLSDPVKVRQVVLSLVTSASRAFRGGGGEVGLTVWREGPKIVFLVAAPGEPLDPRQLELACTDAWPVDRAAWGRSEQVLGLVVARRLARLLGGDVSVRTGQGDGNTLIATFPADVPWSVTVGSPPPADRA